MMNATMRVLRVHAWGQTPVLEAAPTPTLGPGESLVRIEAAAVSHLDLTVLSGRFNVRPALPYIGGVEGAGTIERSERFACGTKVAIRGNGLGLSRDGTWAEFVAVPDAALREIPSDLDAATAATAYSPLTTSYIALHDIGRLGAWRIDQATSSDISVAADEVVAVIGAAGAVGSVATQMALAAGARVIGTVSRAERVPFVPAGAETLSLADDAATARLARDQSVTLLIDTIGGAGFSQRLGWVRPGGRAVMVGYTGGTDVTLNLPNWFLGDVALLPVNMLRREARANALIGGLTEQVMRGALALAVERHAMQHAAIAFERLRRGQARGRLALTWTDA
ncbi:quinone oxidoreductase family protein [Chitinasiproducens palmae]|uniref:NADPH:quinone reductase n=1 Tax=Chitinasiproducens palmae TaxID=1770053 RepID=A0A1H2PKR8_9BURK|nr:zinc-binding dehydrogenase [Chitinasiproducens palmae]SDV46987.1 NADPH:quinone reductase [Chitinasiproducens palmae]